MAFHIFGAPVGSAEIVCKARRIPLSARRAGRPSFLSMVSVVPSKTILKGGEPARVLGPAFLVYFVFMVGLVVFVGDRYVYLVGAGEPPFKNSWCER